MSFSVNIDTSRFAQFSISNNITIQTPPITQQLHNIKTPNLMFSPFFSVNITQPSTIIKHVESARIQELNKSIDLLRTRQEIPKNIELFKSSMQSHLDKNKLDTKQYLNAYNKAQCINDVNDSSQYNNQLQCGVHNAMTGLMTNEPGKTQCVLDLQRAKQEKINGCQKLNH